MAIPFFAAAAGAGSIFKGLAGLGAGRMQAKAAAAQALGAKIEGEMALLRRSQIGERSREDLSTALGNIEAIRAGRGVSLDSATGQAIERRTIQDAYRDEAVAGLAELNRRQNAMMQERGYRTQAKWAMPLAILNSAGDFAQAASYFSMSGKG